jgi:hypothetical protein
MLCQAAEPAAAYLKIDCQMMAAGLLWYGWSPDQNIHWIVPILGTVPVGTGVLSVFNPLSTYLLDAYPEYWASAIAQHQLSSARSSALSSPSLVLRCMRGSAWVGGIACCAFWGVPMLLPRFGESWRENAMTIQRRQWRPLQSCVSDVAWASQQPLTTSFMSAEIATRKLASTAACVRISRLLIYRGYKVILPFSTRAESVHARLFASLMRWEIPVDSSEYEGACSCSAQLEV